MGIAAGGLIKQAIERDTYDPKIWDMDRTILFNVSVLNSNCFKHYTGLNPLETPVTARTYAHAGMPYFKKKSVNELDHSEEEKTGERRKATEDVDLSTKNPVVVLDRDGVSREFTPVSVLERKLREMRLNGAKEADNAE